MIRTDPGSRSLGSDPGIRFRDPRTCLVTIGRLDMLNTGTVVMFHRVETKIMVYRKLRSRHVFLLG